MINVLEEVVLMATILVILMGNLEREYKVQMYSTCSPFITMT